MKTNVLNLLIFFHSKNQSKNISIQENKAQWDCFDLNLFCTIIIIQTFHNLNLWEMCNAEATHGAPANNIPVYIGISVSHSNFSGKFKNSLHMTESCFRPRKLYSHLVILVLQYLIVLSCSKKSNIIENSSLCWVHC